MPCTGMGYILQYPIFQMELKQKISDAKKEAAENDKYLRHWQSEHDKLRLVDIEYVAFQYTQLITRLINFQRR